MAKATECVITALTAIEIRGLAQKSRKTLGSVFRCKECGRPVKVMDDSTAGVAHFEHFRRNVECSLSDKRTIKKAYTAYKANKAAATK